MYILISLPAELLVLHKQNWIYIDTKDLPRKASGKFDYYDQQCVNYESRENNE